jgi:hypothetical protein
MLLRLIQIVIVISLWIPCSSQSIFEFDYHFDIDNVREHYNAFMVRNDDGTGFMRVLYRDSSRHEWVLVDMEIQEHYMGDEDPNDKNKTDSSILVFEGFNPRVIRGPADEEYAPDIFLFQFNEQTDNYEPLGVISEDEDNEYEGVINEVVLLNESDLTKEKISMYFTEKDDIYVNLFEEAQVRNVPRPQTASRLLLIIVANTDDISIGTTCAVDKDATYKTFSTLAEFLQIKFEPTVIFGKDFKKTNVDNAIKNLKPSRNDIVIFYYSGHGFNNEKDKFRFPYLDLRDNVSQPVGGAYTLNVEDIYNTIKSKGARLNLVISDCCNSDPSLSTLSTGDVATTRRSSIGWSANNCRALFMGEQPVSVLATAAAKGELSAGNSTGGIFTFNFRESLEKFFGPFYALVSWDQVMKLSQAQTIRKAKNTLCIQEDNSRKVCVQNPVYKME